MWAHACVLALVLVALVPTLHPRSTFTADEGAYALQVRALEHGSWEYRYKAAPNDPEGKYFPVILSTRNGIHWYTYVQHPAYPLLLLGLSQVTGLTLGLHLLSVLGAVGVAVAAWLLVAEARRSSTANSGLCRVAFWMAAVSPVLVNSQVVWAHASSAAVAGLALVAGLRAIRRGTRSWAAAGAAAALAAGVLLRSEGVLWAAAVALTVAFIRGRRAGSGSGVAALVVLAGPAAAATLAERWWVRAIVGGSGYENLRVRPGPSSFIGGRISGAWHELFQAYPTGATAGLAAVLAAMLVAGLGFLALRRWSSDSPRDLAVAVVVAVGLYGLSSARHPSYPLVGLFAAWPIAALGVTCVAWRRADSSVRVMGVAVGLFVAAVMATQYPEGGGLEWGGRFLSPALAPLAALAAVGLAHRLDPAPLAAKRFASGLLAVLGAATAVAGLVTVGVSRQRQASVVDAIARHRAPVVVTTIPALPRVAWSIDANTTWMLTDNAGLAGLLGSLHDHHVNDVVVVGTGRVRPDPFYSRVEDVREPPLARRGLRLFRLRP